jgi:nicotinic acid phosphoribosyltransferase
MSGLATDLYELRRAAGYLRRGISGPVTFSLFVRDVPPGRGFLVAGGRLVMKLSEGKATVSGATQIPRPEFASRRATGPARRTGT